ncbi:MAG: acylneuraminate cytidylyltransferase family protein [Lachnospiraceae bacterium]|jgi:CMP-N-acetylneuraminic acid synthetase|nr:acylneuraminate cytidylyltransferase family protein [Lachnospiraceae bacterium]
MILGLIPARGGSKGVPNKNIKLINGKPLIVWTIEKALESELLDKVIVSTDSEDIKQIAVYAGAEVLNRPANLATDTASTLDVMIHTLMNYPADTVVLLQPTSPCRNTGLIDKCITEFQKGEYDSLATGFMCDYKEYGTNSLPRQQIEGFFYDDGNVYVIKAENILKGDRYGKNIGHMFISRYENMEIDDAFDFWLLEQILIKQEKEGIL